MNVMSEQASVKQVINNAKVGQPTLNPFKIITFPG